LHQNACKCEYSSYFSGSYISLNTQLSCYRPYLDWHRPFESISIISFVHIDTTSLTTMGQQLKYYTFGGRLLAREASQLQFQIRSSSFRLNLEPEAWRSCSNGSNSTKPSPILTIIFFILLQEKDYHITQYLSRYCF
jgi:hypothetical protein